MPYHKTPRWDYTPRIGKRDKIWKNVLCLHYYDHVWTICFLKDPTLIMVIVTIIKDDAYKRVIWDSATWRWKARFVKKK